MREAAWVVGIGIRGGEAGEMKREGVGFWVGRIGEEGGGVDGKILDGAMCAGGCFTRLVFWGGEGA